jgi:hypothetical protein
MLGNGTQGDSRQIEALGGDAIDELLGRIGARVDVDGGSGNGGGGNGNGGDGDGNGSGGGGGFGSVLPLGGQDVCGQRRQRCEVVAAPARARQSGGAEDGRPQALPCGARARLGSGADRRET